MTLLVSKSDHAALLARASASRTEVCGLLFGTDGRVSHVEHTANVAADPCRRFEVDPARLLAAHRTMRAGGPRLIGHYHSHPTGRPEPSPRDAADAAGDGTIWLIVAGSVVAAWRAVSGGAHLASFAPVPLTIAPGCTRVGGP